MSKTLYLECNSGISGDMFVAAMLDLGASEEKLKDVLNSLDEDFEIKISRVKKMGIDCCDFDVILSKENDNHDHDMEYLYGHTHEHNHEHHGHHHEHNHEHHHEHEYTHPHEHKTLKDVFAIIDKVKMSDEDKQLSKKIFNILGKAEAKAHGYQLEEVHFHEVGAIDSIVDIISAAVCFNDLGFEKVIVPYLCEGHGTIRCAHGILNVPVPATTNIISEYDIPISNLNCEGEFVTPTGAAIVAAVRNSEELPDKYKIKTVGIGAGKRKHEMPGVLRAMRIKKI